MIVLDNRADVLLKTRLNSRFKDISLFDLKRLADNAVNRRYNKLSVGECIFFPIKDRTFQVEIRIKSIVKATRNYGYNPSAECHIEVVSILYDKGDDSDILLFSYPEVSFFGGAVCQ